MKKQRDVIQDTAGNAVPGVTVTVTLTSDGSSAVLFSDAEGLSQYPSNQVLTDEFGIYEFYAEDGRYNISGAKAGAVVTEYDIEIVDSAEFSAAIALLQGFAHTVAGTPSQIIITVDEDGNLTLSTPQSIDTGSDPQFRDLTIRRLAGGTQPVAVYGTGAGASSTPASAALSGDGLRFQLDLTPSASPGTTFSVIATFGFLTDYASAPLVNVQPANRMAASLQGFGTNGANGCAVQSVTVSGFQFRAGDIGLTAGNAYSWQFTIHGK